MGELFSAKVRKVGTSLGILIPKEIIAEEKLKEGQDIELGVLRKRNLDEVLRLFGTAKGTKAFARDRADRY